ncbi:MAG: DNA-protecting protein DprA [Blastocatellia bacterium]|jgi:DNA processing protein|nr:DNA-protecting protein DprA [Blastocatellia bacterium]
MEDIIYWVALALVPGIGAKTGRYLIGKFSTPQQVFAASRGQLVSCRIDQESVESILSGETIAQSQQILSKAEELKVSVIALDYPTYPPLLKQIEDPPLVLYVAGQVEALKLEPMVAVVGSRRCSTYGRHAAEMLSKDLAEAGVTIVSGLARGIDSAAHRGVLDAGGVTVAVLGSGLDQIYPKENEKMFLEICQQGAVASELPFGVPPLSQNFPFRNRIISGLCLGVLVVEAADRSGSLITARMALEQNREVFAVPGNISSANSFGPNYLIKDGAKLVQTWRDVIEELPAAAKAVILREPVSEPVQSTLFSVLELSESEQKIYHLLKKDEPMHIDELSSSAGLAPANLLTILLALEMKDKVKQLSGKNFLKK